jgi:hypothetical protein
VNKILIRNTSILISLSFFAGFILSFLFLWWWNPKLIEPDLSKEILEEISLPNAEARLLWYNNLTRGNPDLKWKVPLNIEDCIRGDKRFVFTGMGSQEAVLLAKVGPFCILKQYREVEFFQSVYLCMVPRKVKEINIYDNSIISHSTGGYCKRLPPVFKKF